MKELETLAQPIHYLKDRNFNIEFITKLEGAHLEYEKEHSTHFNVENAE
ncbi:DUF1447 family protein [Staphylococcus epidermidis]|nr:DUF1447 family protein [Staphylococcus epidermidis]